MDDTWLPGVPPTHPANHLPDEAKQRLLDARAEAGLIQMRALEAIETRYRSECSASVNFRDYCATGQAAIQLSEARMEEARTFLLAWADEFMAAGLPDPELRKVMDYELQAAARNLNLTTMQRSLLWHEILVAVRPGASARRRLQRLQPLSESGVNGSPSLAAEALELGGRTVESQSAENVSRGKIRSDWLDERLFESGCSDTNLHTIGGPTYNALRNYRSGRSGKQDRTIRQKLATAFKCQFCDVPK